ncbi:MAG TPA: hypothetical protein VD966_05290, partial [Pyrinomonadaceae bacterium]|nr:hypothetical protein [Pyrinomonadaceae bacterium]
IKRVAFETRAVGVSRAVAQAREGAEQAAASHVPAPRTIDREEIAAIVDRFLAGRRPDQASSGPAQLHATSSPAPAQPMTDIEPGSMYINPQAAPHAEAAPTAVEARNGGDGSTSAYDAPTPPPAARSSATPPSGSANQAANGNNRKVVDFVSEEDVRRAIQKGEKIFINSRTIITPAARDMGEPAEVFAKG